ncbi:MAG: T9SS type A sorting domain-containing protein [Saprospiraceae bacterium]|nr:T9SS type A sorting domain-containing protein [Saprospiraceae bacterium]
MNFSDTKSGVYLVRIITGEGIIIYKKLIKP